MSGHSKWSQIKNKKGVADAKKGQTFSKLGKIISIAAKSGTDPVSNASLQNAIERARAVNMPKENIERAIKRASEKDADLLSSITIQALCQDGVAIVIESITDNKNRTITEVKIILNKYGAKPVNEGSLNYMFDKKIENNKIVWVPKYPIDIPDNSVDKISLLLEELESNDDIDEVFSNLS